jgi:hypothetical protein
MYVLFLSSIASRYLFCLTLFALLVTVIMYFTVQVLVNVNAVSNGAGCYLSYRKYKGAHGTQVVYQILFQALLTNIFGHRYLLSKVRKFCTAIAYAVAWNLTASLFLDILDDSRLESSVQCM